MASTREDMGAITDASKSTVARETVKISAGEFAKKSSTSNDRVLRYLKAWVDKDTKPGKTDAIGARAPKSSASKVSATRFAEMSETRQTRISRHLKAWEAAAVNTYNAEMGL